MILTQLLNTPLGNTNIEIGGKSLGWQRDGNEPVAGPYPDRDTSNETLHGPLDVNLQETRNIREVADPDPRSP
jgi:hypothetical protein